MIHKRLVILGFLTLLLIFASFMYFERDKDSIAGSGELLISQYQGYVAGYVNDTVRLDIYWIKIGNNNFSGVFGVRNLPSCLSADKITLTETVYFKNPDINERTISVRLKLKTPGRCGMKDAYLIIQRQNTIKKLHLGSITFEIYRKPDHPSLRIPKYIIGSIGSEPSPPMLQYTFYNPFNDSVKILNVVFEVPGLRVLKLQAPVILPQGEANLTIITENTTKMGRLYIIRPMIIYKAGSRRYSMPAEAFYYATIPDEKKLSSVLTGEEG
ncbi:MAG: hypothetical protein J7K57_00725 [Palaeococcus sp.]|uniref:hypothetical protein n=1 Tax=Palaeococcus sp. (in: euryarchaeotes) TaxID=2820298 RepID=UPI0025F319BC|nr:hypothetical protein [Palaeococcus sp. (in: euryarchaeotes)]MCD6558398.1 hypothetical protein [Palaeococcus sp. (in: euryarchaeotes)]